MVMSISDNVTCQVVPALGMRQRGRPRLSSAGGQREKDGGAVVVRTCGVAGTADDGEAPVIGSRGLPHIEGRMR